MDRFHDPEIKMFHISPAGDGLAHHISLKWALLSETEDFNLLGRIPRTRDI